jgi:hypothetical protein
MTEILQAEAPRCTVCKDAVATNRDQDLGPVCEPCKGLLVELDSKLQPTPTTTE